MGKRKTITTEQVIRELAAIGLARVTDFLDVRDGQMQVLPTDQIPADKLAAVASVEHTSTGLRLKFYDKLKALELLGKYLGAFDGNQSAQERENTLLKAILESTKEALDTGDIPEIQQTTAIGHDLVEPSGTERP